MKKFAFIFLLILNFVAFGQSKFDIGFKEGFENGYCYSNKQQSSYICTPPQPPIAPLPQINEDKNSYRDGYNRGFIYGQTHRNKYDNNSSSNNISTNNPKYNDYVSQNPTNLMIEVGMLKQKKFNERTNWTQQRIYQLTDLINNLFNKKNLPTFDIEKTRNIYYTKVNEYVNSISGIDFGDDYQFRNVVEGFITLENNFYKSYNTCLEYDENFRLENEAEEKASSQLGMIGISFEKFDNHIQITEISYGGAAWKSNQLKVGDKIVKVSQGYDSPINIDEKMSANDVKKLITGTKGTMVRLTIERDYNYKIISLTRE